MDRLPLIVHERLGTWARQLRPRVAGWPVSLVETRSAADLAAALGRSTRPLAVVDLSDRPGAALADLAAAGAAGPDALVLVLDPGARPGVAAAARELGAALVLAGPVPPPSVVALLGRWVALARRRAEGDGWGGDAPGEPEPWDLTAPA